MASLTGQTISSTYDSLLKVTDNGPLNSSLKTITDGLGNSSSLQLSTIAAYITGGLTVTGQLTLPGAFDLTVNGFTIGKGPGALNNTVYGFQSLLSNTTGVFNTANGYQALYNNTIGEYNTAFGLQSMFSNVAGGNNVGIGANALPSNTSGNNNTAIGRYAGFGTGTNNNITGSNNIFIGYQSVGISSSESNRTWIGNSSTLATWVGGNLLVGGTTNNGFGLEVTGTAKISGQLTLGSTITNGTYTYTLPSATGTIALVGGAGVGTVTSVAALTLGTSGTDLSSTVANGTTTPVITLNVPNASATARGVVTTGTQTFAGAKTFNNGLSASNSIGNTIASTCSATGGLAFYGQSSGGIGAQFESGASGEAALIAKHTNSGPLQYWMTTSGVVATMSNAGALTIAGQLSLGSTITNGTYTYTLPSATGTLALTSALSGYLPLTGGTLSTTNTSETLRILNSGTGYGLYVQSDSYFQGDVTLQGYLKSPLYTYTLPSATGTLALTSALSSYLPLSGGTLTGKLIISGVTGNNLQSNRVGTGPHYQTWYEADGTTRRGYFGYGESATNNFSLMNEQSGSLVIGTNSINALAIASTGAATFSGNVASASFSSSGQISTGNGADADILINVTTAGAATKYASIQSSVSGRNLVLNPTNGGNVGIGVTAPSYPLHLKNATFSQLYIEGGSAADLILYNSGGSANTRTMVYRQGTGGTAKFFSANDAGTINKDNILVLDNSTGQVAIGAALTGRLSVRGTTNDSTAYAFEAGNSSGNTLFAVRNDAAIYAPGVYSFTTGSSANVVVFSDGSMQRSTSSLKYKKNVENYTKGLAEVMQLRPVSYEGKCEIDKGKIFAGLIAEEVHELGLTEFVQYAEDGSPDALSYTNMIALAFKAIQELKAEIDLLKGEPIVEPDNNLE